MHYSATISKSSVVSAIGCSIAQAPDSNYVEFNVLVTFEPRLSPKTSELALSVFIKVVDLFLGLKMDTSFASFGLGMREL